MSAPIDPSQSGDAGGLPVDTLHGSAHPDIDRPDTDHGDVLSRVGPAAQAVPQPQPPASAPAPAKNASYRRRFVTAGIVSWLLFFVVAAWGDSAAVVGLGPLSVMPSWDFTQLALRPPSWLVTLLLAAAYVAGAACVWTGWQAVRHGWGIPPRRLLIITAVAAFSFTLVPPVGSADHLSYVAYGRIAAAGDDPYLVAPAQWRGDIDPVASAVQPPWRDTPSVYGPVATATFTAVAWLGNGNLRATVWWWQLCCALAFFAVVALVARFHREDATAASYGAVLWALNPILLAQLVLGAHVDVAAAAAGIAALWWLQRRPFLAGACVALAVGIKAPYALFALGGLWGLRKLPRAQLIRNLIMAIGGALLVLIPAHLWAGSHVFRQLSTASGFTSLASPWRAVANTGEVVFGRGAMRSVVVPLALALSTGLAFLLWRHVIRHWDTPEASPTMSALVMTSVLTTAWCLCAPYALPWYVAMSWAPLAFLGRRLAQYPIIPTALLVQVTTLALAYIPGRTVGLSSAVSNITLGIRGFVAPVVIMAIIVAAFWWARQSRDASHD